MYHVGYHKGHRPSFNREPPVESATNITVQQLRRRRTIVVSLRRRRAVVAPLCRRGAATPSRRRCAVVAPLRRRGAAAPAWRRCAVVAPLRCCRNAAPSSHRCDVVAASRHRRRWGRCAPGRPLLFVRLAVLHPAACACPSRPSAQCVCGVLEAVGVCCSLLWLWRWRAWSPACGKCAGVRGRRGWWCRRRRVLLSAALVGGADRGGGLHLLAP